LVKFHHIQMLCYQFICISYLYWFGIEYLLLRNCSWIRPGLIVQKDYSQDQSQGRILYVIVFSNSHSLMNLRVKEKQNTHQFLVFRIILEIFHLMLVIDIFAYFALFHP